MLVTPHTEDGCLTFLGWPGHHTINFCQPRKNIAVKDSLPITDTTDILVVKIEPHC